MNKSKKLHVLILTSEWPTPAHPEWVPFLVQQVRYLEMAGVDVDVFSFRGGKNPFRYLMAWIELRKKWKVSQFSLMHAHFGQSALLALPKKIPLVITFHGSDLQGYIGNNGQPTITGELLKWVSRVVSRWADRCIVVSNHLAKYLPADSKIEIIPGGIDLHLFSPISQTLARNTLNLPPDVPLILFAGHPKNPIKRFILAEKAVSLLVKDTHAQLITVHGVSHILMPVYLSACNALLLTSKHEGSPTIVKEALACNLPIVSTDVGDVLERIGAIEGCEVCADDRPETIAAALTRVLSRSQRINGRQAVLELDEKLLAQKVIRVYQRAIQKKEQT